MKPLEASTGERSTRGRRKGDNPAQERGDPGGPVGRNPYTPMLPGRGNRPRYTPEEKPKPLEGMEEGRSMKGKEVRREGGKVSVCRCP
jgi:hypothetical protein